jgi:hypothetical protein
MDSTSLDVAFSRLGADVAGRGRPQWANARDGSLVLVCQSSGFTRPSAGVLRYSAQLSLTRVGLTQIPGLRVSLGAALTGSTPVRLIIQTPAAGRVSGRVHVRADLVGSITSFDGDTYSVDFVRPVPIEDPAPVRTRRKR